MKLEDYDKFGTYWVGFYVKNNNVTYFDSDVVKNIPKKINIIGYNYVRSNSFKMQVYD